MRAAARVTVLLAAWLASSCERPCTLDADCGDARCVDGLCAHECQIDFDCPLSTRCEQRVCVPEDAVATVISPQPGDVVGDRFDLELEVTFRGHAEVSLARIDGDACAPFVPLSASLVGSGDTTLTLPLTFSGVRALGSSFGVLITAAGNGTTKTELPLVGAPTDYGGATLAPPLDVVDISALPWFRVPIGFAAAPLTASSWIEPDAVDNPGMAPSPRVPVRAGGAVLAPMVYGGQVLWLEADDRRCGVGLSGVGSDVDALELALAWDGDNTTALAARVRVVDDEHPAGRVCTSGEDDPSCTSTLEPDLGVTGGQVLRVPAAITRADVVVVPAALGGSTRASVRVSWRGRHVGWLGPIPITTSAGQVWNAGSVVIVDGQARLFESDPASALVDRPPF